MAGFHGKSIYQFGEFPSNHVWSPSNSNVGKMLISQWIWGYNKSHFQTKPSTKPGYPICLIRGIIIYAKLELKADSRETHDYAIPACPRQRSQKHNWLVVWNIFIFPYIGNVIIPTDELHHFPIALPCWHLFRWLCQLGRPFFLAVFALPCAFSMLC